MATLPPPPPSPPVGAPARLAQGQLFATDLRVVAPLSEGDLSADYLVSSLVDGRMRVLTVLAPGLTASAEDAREFLAKASLGAAIGGDRLIAALAAGVHEGQPWTVSDSLDGESLSTRLSTRGAMSWEETADAAWAIGEGLAPLHDRGLGHGALDPSTVFLENASRGPSQRPRLRLARVGVGRLLRQARLAQHAGGVAVDPDALRWTSPEQWRGVRHARPPADVWALGLLAFEMLTARSFWDGDAPTEPGGGASGAWPTASERAEAVGATDALPTGFDGWFARCTREDEAGRYPDAVAAVSALLDLLGRTDAPRAPTTPPPPVVSLSPRKPLRDDPSVVVATVSAAPATVAADALRSSEVDAARARSIPPPAAEGPSTVPPASLPPPDAPASVAPPAWTPKDEAPLAEAAAPAPDDATPPGEDAPAPLDEARPAVADEDEDEADEDEAPPREPRPDRPPPWRRHRVELSPEARRQRRVWLSLGLCTALMLWAATIVTSAKLYPEWLVPWRGDAEGSHLPPSYEMRWPDGTTRRWHGRWEADGLVLGVDYELSRRGATIRGRVAYVVESPTAARPSLRVGARFDERVRGRFTSSEGLVLEGRQASRPAAFGAVTHEISIGGDGTLDGDASQADGTRAHVEASPAR